MRAQIVKFARCLKWTQLCRSRLQKGRGNGDGWFGGGGQKPIFKDNYSVSTIDDKKNVCCLYLR